MLNVALLFSRYLSLRKGGHFLRPGLSQGTRGPFLNIRPRPEKEMAALLDSYGRHMKAEREQGADWDWDRPLVFGLGRAPLEWSRPEKLASLEEMLSPGSLRDVVHVTRLAAKTYDSETVAEKRLAMGELLRWLDSRPEIERHWLAMQLKSWCWHNKGLGRFGYELMHELIARLPERYGAEPDYRENTRRQYLLDHPGAAEYWGQAETTR